jgi:hypothetical protein
MVFFDSGSMPAGSGPGRSSGLLHLRAGVVVAISSSIGANRWVS